MVYTKTTFVDDNPPDLDADYFNTLEATVYDNDLKMTDLIAGVTPTYTGWDVDPTDGDDITDGDSTTICTTGSTAVTAWGLCHFEWNFGSIYNVIITGIVGSTATVGTPYVFGYILSGGAWRSAFVDLNSGTNEKSFTFGGICSQLRLSITSSSNATVTPNIRCASVFRR